MNTLIRIVLAVLLIPALAGIVRAQIPNAGFETWTNSTTPGSWVPNNTGFWTTVSRTTTSHTGTYAAQGQVTTYASSPIAPTLTSIVFPVSQRATALSGYYRFTQLGGDQIGAIVVMLKNSSAIGAGAGVDTVAYSSFTQVSIPIYYDDTTTVPDSAYIEIFIGPHTDSSKVHVGSSFIVDDLTFGGVSAVKELPGLPAAFRLEQNFPNPFNPTTNIRFSIPQESRVVLKIFNMLGQEVQTLVNERRPAGNYTVDLNGAALPSGIYFYTLSAGTSVQSRKMILMK